MLSGSLIHLSQSSAIEFYVRNENMCLASILLYRCHCPETWTRGLYFETFLLWSCLASLLTTGPGDFRVRRSCPFLDCIWVTETSEVTQNGLSLIGGWTYTSLPCASPSKVQEGTKWWFTFVLLARLRIHSYSCLRRKWPLEVKDYSLDMGPHRLLRNP